MCSEDDPGATDRFKDSLLEDVQAPSLQGNADGLLVLMVAQATQEHLVDDALQPGVDALLLLVLRKLGVLHPLLGVVINAFGYGGKDQRSSKNYCIPLWNNQLP